MSFAKWYRKVCMVFTALAVASLAIMIISTTSDTTLRYAINFPIPGVFEATRFFWLWSFTSALHGDRVSEGILVSSWS